jgi:hypothetical protein
MTVYVDDFGVPAIVGRHTSRWSHMITDNPDLEELHAFAERIGLRRSYFQGKDPHHPHYDVTANKREQALRLGAKPIKWREMPEILRARRSLIAARNSEEPR